jgi:hypothetical protein
MNFYSDGTRHLMIPTVIGAAARFSRDLTIRVTVLDRDGQPVASKAELIQREPDGGRAAVSEEEFFRAVWARFSPAEGSACRKTLQQLETSGVPGLRKEVRRDGRPVIVVQDTRWGTVTVLWVARTVPVIRDSLEINPSLKNDGDALRSWTEFRGALTKIGGAEQKNGRVFIPVLALTEDRYETLVGALRNLASSLRGDVQPK